MPSPDMVKLVAAAVVPSAVILALLNLRFDGRGLRAGRPWSIVLLAFAMGALSSFPAYYMEKLLTVTPWSFKNFGVLFAFAMIVAGMVEESCKFVAFYLGPRRSRWFAEEYDGILLVAAVSLGFATLENIVYVREGGLATAYTRAFTAIPLHACCGVLMGSYLGMARARKSVRWSDANLPLSGLLAAVALHGMYDVLAFHDASVISQWALIALLGVAGVWCIRRARQARARSIAFGGRWLAVPPPLGASQMHLTPAPVGRNPYAALALGFLPGAGQLYNGERTKAMLFFLVACINLALYYLAYFFVYKPLDALDWLKWLGVLPTVVMTPEEFARAIEQKWMLVPILLSMVLTWEVIGAFDAYCAARQRWQRPQAYSVRRSFASHGFGSSYVVHLIVVFMIVFVPVLREASGASGDRNGKDGGGQQQAKEKGKKEGEAGDSWQLTWVGAPVRLDGFDPTKIEGTADGDSKLKPGDRPLPTAQKGPGLVKIQPGQQKSGKVKGEGKSYDEYLSAQIRRNDGDSHYFKHVPRGVWTVVRYLIDKDGNLLDAQLVKTSGTIDEAERALDVVRNAAPYAPLPGVANRIQVTELFWSQNSVFFTPGSLEDKLSHYPDGRYIVALP